MVQSKGVQKKVSAQNLSIYIGIRDTSKYTQVFLILMHLFVVTINAFSAARQLGVVSPNRICCGPFVAEHPIGYQTPRF